MARHVRDANFETRTARARLKARGRPYYRSVDGGLHVGYRKSKNGGKWVMRWYVGNQQYLVETIGTADDIIDADGVVILNFSQAQAKARDLFVRRKREQAGLPAHRGGGYTVRTCIQDYLAWMEHERETAHDSRTRANALILPTLGNIECAKLSADQIRKWRDTLAAMPPRLRTRKNDQQKFRKIANDDEAKRVRKASANRTLTILKAALNRAWREDKIATDVWRRVEPFKKVDAARVRYLTIDECKRLINSSAGDFRALVQAALATGARYGELAALNVGDFNVDSGTLHVRTSKSGHGRDIVLTDEGLKLFGALCAGRAPDAPMLEKSGGGRWAKSHQARRIKEICDHARINPPVSFHILRHVYASHAVMNGAPLFVVARNLGHRDTRMIEKHYGHLTPSYVADVIRKAAPKFGIKADRKVAPMRHQALAR